MSAQETNRPLATRLEEIGSAAAGIAHDINNQLLLILNHLEATDLQGAREAAARCTALTSSLLSYCRGESAPLTPLEPATFLRDFAATLRLPAAVTLALDLPPALPAIKADPAALSRVLTNLISNACDAMQNRGALTLRATPLCIELADSGPGIPAAGLRQVFEPFFTTKGVRGTGLGLAIVRDIMRRHGGSVTARSEPGQGACFTLRFRAAGAMIPSKR